MILDMPNAMSDPENDVAARIARQTLASRAPDYSTEVRRLLDAGRTVIRRCGTESRPRVADIVSEAGLSNDAFYRHFASKDALVVAILEDGTQQLRSYLEHQMAKDPTPAGKVRRWVHGVMAQAADDDVAATTLAVLWNAAGVQGTTSAGASASAPLAALLEAPFAELGSSRPELDAELVGLAIVGRLAEHLWAKSRAPRAELDHLVGFCLATARAGSSNRRASR